LVQSKKVARVEFGLELPQPFERLRIICGLHPIRALDLIDPEKDKLGAEFMSIFGALDKLCAR
jgi:hypothetical protein